MFVIFEIDRLVDPLNERGAEPIDKRKNVDGPFLKLSVGKKRLYKANYLAVSGFVLANLSEQSLFS
jgi:hypothetical protein